MGGTNLLDFIESARNKGVGDSAIKTTLLQHGWKEQDIEQAMSAKGFSLPVPPPVQHFGMWIGFLYIILFISLYVCASSFAGILDYAVDANIPDALDRSETIYTIIGQYLMQYYLASLIVGFPIFAGLFIFLKKQTLKNPAIKGIRSRKILVYITLIGTFLIILGHLISTVYGFLGGIITTRTIGHLGVTLLVAGSIFIYFLVEIWGDRKQI